jgi:DNA mismatch endonuclease, patch repair protein
MVDRLSAKRRSWLMSRVRRENTAPELSVRRLISAIGYRYRLHAPELPGRPDIVFRKTKKVIFVHGCFWHHHIGCRLATIPKSRTGFWRAKFSRNRARDAAILERLESGGWRTLTIWQCQIRDLCSLEKRIRAFLGPSR